MENFFSLRAEKQEHIINAALFVFGNNGYKKASIADIAEEAGIAKGMINYYFGSKKNLYIYLTDLCAKIVIEEMEKGFDKEVTDYFDKIKMMTDIKIAIMKRHSAAISFLTSVYFETSKDVRDNIKRFISENMHIRERWVLGEADTSKFKDGIDPKLLDTFLVWAGEGMAGNLTLNEDTGQLDAFVADFYQCLDYMKEHFYKG